MKKTLYIARNELYSLVYSPVAWVILGFFLIMTAANYISITDLILGLVKQGGTGIDSKNLTSKITTSTTSGYLLKVINSLFLFLPLVTMGVISRETSNGTMKLLYSSPIRIWQVVIGKYLAMLCFVVCMMAVMMTTIVALCLSVSNPDYGQLMASVLGLAVVIATYIAIGIFISSLTGYQIVAGVITFAVFLLFSEVGTLWQDIDWVRNITYYLDMPAKSVNTISGLLNSRDLIYYLVIITAFLLFTIIKIKSATAAVPIATRVFRYTVVIAGAFGLAYLSSQPSLILYKDVTRAQLHTISSSSQHLLQSLNQDKLKLTFYVNLLGSRFGLLSPSHQNEIKTVFDPFIRFKPDIEFDFVYYYKLEPGSRHDKVNPGKTAKEIAGVMAKTHRLSLDMFLSPDEVNKQVNTSQVGHSQFFKVDYNGQSAILGTFADPPFWPSETEFSAVLKRFVETPPKVLFVTDGGARDPFDSREFHYKTIANTPEYRNSLINQGYDIDTISLSGRQRIPLDVAAVVIADPRTPFSRESLLKINDYLDKGGNLLLACEPDRKEVTAPILEKLGLGLREGMLIQPSDKGSDYVSSYVTDKGMALTPQLEQYMKDKKKTSGDTLVIMHGASAINFESGGSWRIEPLMVTDNRTTWNSKMLLKADQLQQKLSKHTGDESGSFATAVRLSRQSGTKEQRIIVTGDADFFRVFELPKVLAQNVVAGHLFHQFTYGKFPANSLKPESTDNSFTISMKDIPKQKLIFYWILPGLLAVSGFVLLMRRKRN